MILRWGSVTFLSHVKLLEILKELIIVIKANHQLVIVVVVVAPRMSVLYLSASCKGPFPPQPVSSFLYL